MFRSNEKNIYSASFTVSQMEAIKIQLNLT